MKIGLAQMNSRSDKEENLRAAEKLIDRLANQGAALIVLPEYFNFMGPEDMWRENAEELESSPSLARIRQKAVDHKVHIHCGSILERSGENIYNTGVVFSPQGHRVSKYRKIHLFDVEIPGGRSYFESETITPGDHIESFTIGKVAFGMATCYDLRFPELFRAFATRGIMVIILPAAFTMMTGKDHWELLIRARAVENLCYVAAPGQYGSCPPNHSSYGRSMVVDPWGVVIAQAGDGVTTITGEIDIKFLEEKRRSFPVLDHIRNDIWKHTLRFI